jgi:adenosylhomocysteine nucleosidase
LLAFIAAERRELEGVLSHAEGIRKPEWPVDFARIARLNARDVVLVANGPGPSLAGRAADVVREHLGMGMDALVSVGFCGALDPALEVCEIFVATEVKDIGAARAPAIAGHAYKSGKLLSMDRVVSTPAERAVLHASGGDAVEMEAAALIARARQWDVPFYAIRVVTDTAREAFALDFNRMRDREGRFSLPKILAGAARKPVAVLPELLKLNQRSKCAAKALGDFIADARF